MRRIVILFVLLLAQPALHPLAAQERRVVAVGVYRGNGTFVEGLTATDFRGEFRGRDVKIVSVELDASPRRVALLLDASYGMRRDGQWNAALNAFRHAVGSFAVNNPLALYTLTPELTQVTSLTTDLDELKEGLAVLPETIAAAPRRLTPLYRSLEKISWDFGPPQFGDTIFVLSDGKDGQYPQGRRETEELLAGRGSRVFILCFARKELKQLERAWQEYGVACATLPGLTGGSSSTVRVNAGETLSTDSVLRSARALYPYVIQSYKVTIELPEGVNKRREWDLHLVDQRGKRRIDVVVSYPKLLVPATSEEEKR